MILGRTTAGTLTLTQDSQGLAFSVVMPKTAIAKDTVENVRNGNLNSCSFGFNVPSGGDKWMTTPDGAALRTLLDVNLAEVSITSFAAYPATSVNLPSDPPEIRSLITRSNDDGCDCDCEDYLDDDCENCRWKVVKIQTAQRMGVLLKITMSAARLSVQSEKHKLQMRLNSPNANLRLMASLSCPSITVQGDDVSENPNCRDRK